MQRRRGFTLVEILVVVTILALLTVLIVAAFRGNEAQKVRDAGRVAQSSILGARDRALHAKANRGFRLLVDPNDNNIATGFVYLQPMDPLPFGTPVNSTPVEFENIDLDADGKPDVLRVRGFQNPGWSTIDGMKAFSVPKMARYPAVTGHWIEWNNLQTVSPTVQSIDILLPEGISVGMVYPQTDARAQLELRMFNEILPAHAPIALPAGVVVDIGNSSPNARNDLMFSPGGSITGPAAANGPIYLLLRDIREVTEGINPASTSAGVIHRDMLIVAISPQTGHVQNYPVDQTDSDNNGTADDLFRFAKLGSAAGG